MEPTQCEPEKPGIPAAAAPSQQHPPPSPLSGCYLLVVLPEPHNAQHKDLILNRIAKGFLSWDKDDCHVDLEKELQALVTQAPEGEEARNGERLIQYATENLVTEILIHPQTNTLLQCIRNLLASFTKHRHIIHAGYTFSENGSWILQDGTFSFADFLDAFNEHDVQRVLRAYENSVTVDINCVGIGEWSMQRLSKEPCIRSCRVRVNPDDVLTAGVPAICNFTNYISQYLTAQSLEELMQPSDVVGNIRFSHPTLYIFPGGQGDAALFGINGFNMLVDGGFGRKSCFWDFTRHLDRLDAVLLTRMNNSNVGGMSSVLRKKRQMQVYPQIGHFFCNLVEKKQQNSPDGDKDVDPLILSLTELGQEMMLNLKHINLRPHPCYRESEPINLYHKVGHGTLDMYVLSPSKESREVREFLSKWNAGDCKLFAGSYRKDSNSLAFPIQNLTSICALLVWQPANPEDTITRILFPGSTPQHKIFEGIERLRHLEFLKHSTCTAKTISPSASLVTLKEKQAMKIQKFTPIIDKDKEIKRSIDVRKTKQKDEDTKAKAAIESTDDKAKLVLQTKTKKQEIVVENKHKIDADIKKESAKEMVKDVKKIVKDDVKKTEIIKSKGESDKTAITREMKAKTTAAERKKEDKEDKSSQKMSLSKAMSMEKKGKSTSKKMAGKPEEMIMKTKSAVEKPAVKARVFPPAAPKSAKDANNRKVVEQKNIERMSMAKGPAKGAKPPPSSGIEKKSVPRRGKQMTSGSPSKAKFIPNSGSPIKSSTKSTTAGLSVKSDMRRMVKAEKGGGDSSTVSTPSAPIEVDQSINKFTDKCLTEKSEDMSLDSIESKVLADLKEERQVVEEIEAVLQKAERIEGARKETRIETEDDVTTDKKDITTEDMTEDDVTADIDEVPRKSLSRKTSQEQLTEEEEDEEEYLIIEKEEEEVDTEDSVHSGEAERKHFLDVVQSEKEKIHKDSQEKQHVNELEELEELEDDEQDQRDQQDEEEDEGEEKEVAEEKDVIEEGEESDDIPEKREQLDKVEKELLSININKEQLAEEMKDIITSATESVLHNKVEDKDDSGKKDSEDITKEPSSLSPDKLDSSEKKTTDTADNIKPGSGVDSQHKLITKEKMEESQERISTIESGATTTAPTLPEDERISLEAALPKPSSIEIKAQSNIEEENNKKIVDTAIKPKNIVPPPPLSAEVKQTETRVFNVRQGLQQRDIVKTPDEVADLPVHEEVDPKLYKMDDFEKSTTKEEKTQPPPTVYQEKQSSPGKEQQKGVFSFFGKVADKFEKGMDKLTKKTRRDSEKDVDEKSSSPKQEESTRIEDRGEKLLLAEEKKLDNIILLQEKGQAFEDLEDADAGVEALLEEASKKFKTVKDSLRDSLESLEEKIVEEEINKMATTAALAISSTNDDVKDTLEEVVEKLGEIKPKIDEIPTTATTQQSDEKVEVIIPSTDEQQKKVEEEAAADLQGASDHVRDLREAVLEVGEVLAGTAGINIEEAPKDVIEIVKKVAEVLKEDDFLSEKTLFSASSSGDHGEDIEQQVEKTQVLLQKDECYEESCVRKVVGDEHPHDISPNKLENVTDDKTDAKAICDDLMKGEAINRTKRSLIDEPPGIDVLEAGIEKICQKVEIALSPKEEKHHVEHVESSPQISFEHKTSPATAEYVIVTPDSPLPPSPKLQSHLEGMEIIPASNLPKTKDPVTLPAEIVKIINSAKPINEIIHHVVFINNTKLTMEIIEYIISVKGLVRKQIIDIIKDIITKNKVPETSVVVDTDILTLTKDEPEIGSSLEDHSNMTNEKSAQIVEEELSIIDREKLEIEAEILDEYLTRGEKISLKFIEEIHTRRKIAIHLIIQVIEYVIIKNKLKKESIVDLDEVTWEKLKYDPAEEIEEDQHDDDDDDDFIMVPSAEEVENIHFAENEITLEYIDKGKKITQTIIEEIHKKRHISIYIIIEIIEKIILEKKLQKQSIIDIPESVWMNLKSEALEQVKREILSEKAHDDFEAVEQEYKIPSVPPKSEIMQEKNKLQGEREEDDEDPSDVVEAQEKDTKISHEKDEDSITVKRMIVTATSEDGGDETIICPTGSITFASKTASPPQLSPIKTDLDLVKSKPITTHPQPSTLELIKKNDDAPTLPDDYDDKIEDPSPVESIFAVSPLKDQSTTPSDQVDAKPIIMMDIEKSKEEKHVPSSPESSSTKIDHADQALYQESQTLKQEQFGKIEQKIDGKKYISHPDDKTTKQIDEQISRKSSISTEATANHDDISPIEVAESSHPTVSTVQPVIIEKGITIEGKEGESTTIIEEEKNDKTQEETPRAISAIDKSLPPKRIDSLQSLDDITNMKIDDEFTDKHSQIQHIPVKKEITDITIDDSSAISTIEVEDSLLSKNQSVKVDDSPPTTPSRMVDESQSSKSSRDRSPVRKESLLLQTHAKEIGNDKKSPTSSIDDAKSSKSSPGDSPHVRKGSLLLETEDKQIDDSTSNKKPLMDISPVRKENLLSETDTEKIDDIISDEKSPMTVVHDQPLNSSTDTSSIGKDSLLPEIQDKMKIDDSTADEKGLESSVTDTKSSKSYRDTSPVRKESLLSLEIEDEEIDHTAIDKKSPTPSTADAKSSKSSGDTSPGRKESLLAEIQNEKTDDSAIDKEAPTPSVASVKSSKSSQDISPVGRESLLPEMQSEKTNDLVVDKKSPTSSVADIESSKSSRDTSPVRKDILLAEIQDIKTDNAVIDEKKSPASSVADIKSSKSSRDTSPVRKESLLSEIQNEKTDDSVVDKKSPVSSVADVKSSKSSRDTSPVRKESLLPVDQDKRTDDAVVDEKKSPTPSVADAKSSKSSRDTSPFRKDSLLPEIENEKTDDSVIDKQSPVSSVADAKSSESSRHTSPVRKESLSAEIQCEKTDDSVVDNKSPTSSVTDVKSSKFSQDTSPARKESLLPVDQDKRIDDAVVDKKSPVSNIADVKSSKSSRDTSPTRKESLLPVDEDERTDDAVVDAKKSPSPSVTDAKSSKSSRDSSPVRKESLLAEIQNEKTDDSVIDKKSPVSSVADVKSSKSSRDTSPVRKESLLPVDQDKRTDDALVDEKKSPTSSVIDAKSSKSSRDTSPFRKDSLLPEIENEKTDDSVIDKQSPTPSVADGKSSKSSRHTSPVRKESLSAEIQNEKTDDSEVDKKSPASSVADAKSSKCSRDTSPIRTESLLSERDQNDKVDESAIDNKSPMPSVGDAQSSKGSCDTSPVRKESLLSEIQDNRNEDTVIDEKKSPASSVVDVKSSKSSRDVSPLRKESLLSEIQTEKTDDSVVDKKSPTSSVVDAKSLKSSRDTSPVRKETLLPLDQDGKTDDSAIDKKSPASSVADVKSSKSSRDASPVRKENLLSERESEKTDDSVVDKKSPTSIVADPKSLKSSRDTSPVRKECLSPLDQNKKADDTAIDKKSPASSVIDVESSKSSRDASPVRKENLLLEIQSEKTDDFVVDKKSSTSSVVETKSSKSSADTSPVKKESLLPVDQDEKTDDSAIDKKSPASSVADVKSSRSSRDASPVRKDNLLSETQSEKADDTAMDKKSPASSIADVKSSKSSRDTSPVRKESLLPVDQDKKTDDAVVDEKKSPTTKSSSVIDAKSSKSSRDTSPAREESLLSTLNDEKIDDSVINEKKTETSSVGDIESLKSFGDLSPVRKESVLTETLDKTIDEKSTPSHVFTHDDIKLSTISRDISSLINKDDKECLLLEAEGNKVDETLTIASSVVDKIELPESPKDIPPIRKGSLLLETPHDAVEIDDSKSPIISDGGDVKPSISSGDTSSIKRGSLSSETDYKRMQDLASDTKSATDIASIKSSRDTSPVRRESLLASELEDRVIHDETNQTTSSIVDHTKFIDISSMKGKENLLLSKNLDKIIDEKVIEEKLPVTRVESLNEEKFLEPPHDGCPVREESLLSEDEAKTFDDSVAADRKSPTTSNAVDGAESSKTSDSTIDNNIQDSLTSRQIKEEMLDKKKLDSTSPVEKEEKFRSVTDEQVSPGTIENKQLDGSDSTKTISSHKKTSDLSNLHSDTPGKVSMKLEDSLVTHKDDKRSSHPSSTEVEKTKGKFATSPTSPMTDVIKKEDKGSSKDSRESSDDKKSRASSPLELARSRQEGQSDEGGEGHVKSSSSPCDEDTVVEVKGLVKEESKYETPSQIQKSSDFKLPIGLSKYEETLQKTKSSPSPTLARDEAKEIPEVPSRDRSRSHSLFDTGEKTPLGRSRAASLLPLEDDIVKSVSVSRKSSDLPVFHGEHFIQEQTTPQIEEAEDAEDDFEVSEAKRIDIERYISSQYVSRKRKITDAMIEEIVGLYEVPSYIVVETIYDICERMKIPRESIMENISEMQESRYVSSIEEIPQTTRISIEDYITLQFIVKKKLLCWTTIQEIARINGVNETIIYAIIEHIMHEKKIPRENLLEKDVRIEIENRKAHFGIKEESPHHHHQFERGDGAEEHTSEGRSSGYSTPEVRHYDDKYESQFHKAFVGGMTEIRTTHITTLSGKSTPDVGTRVDTPESIADYSTVERDRVDSQSPIVIRRTLVTEQPEYETVIKKTVIKREVVEDADADANADADADADADKSRIITTAESKGGVKVDYAKSLMSSSCSGRSTPERVRDSSGTATPDSVRSHEVIKTTITKTRTMSEDGDIITTTKEVTETTNDRGETVVLEEKIDVKTTPGAVSTVTASVADVSDGEDVDNAKLDSQARKSIVSFSAADMSSSFYGQLPDTPPQQCHTTTTECPPDPEDESADFSFKKFKHAETTSDDKMSTSRQFADMADYDVDKVLKEQQDQEERDDEGDKDDPIKAWGTPLKLPSPERPDKFNLRSTPIVRSSVDMSPDSLNFDLINDWGEPLRLPSPGPTAGDEAASNKAVPTTPKKERKQPKKIIAENLKNSNNTNSKKRSDSPASKGDKKKDSTKKISPIYVDLTYVPHHGNSYYASLDFFKRIRARYYVFSGTEPSKEVYDALLDAKKTWENKNLEVTMIPTYDTDTLGYWVADNEEALAANHIDLSPSASRCTINLQDHETSCSAYRLEF